MTHGCIVRKVRFARDSPLEGGGFEPSVPRLRWSSVQLSWRRATRPMPPRNADRSRRRVRRAISAMPGAPFTWTKAGVEIGFRDFEHLVAPFSPSRQRWKSVGTIGFVMEGSHLMLKIDYQ